MMSETDNQNLLAAALTAITHTKIVAAGTPTNSMNSQGYQHLDPDSLHQTQLSRGPVHSVKQVRFSLNPQAKSQQAPTTSSSEATGTDLKGKSIIIYIKTLTGKKITLSCDPVRDTIEAIKDKIQIVEKILPAQQKLQYSGQELDDIQTLAFYKIKNKSTLYLSMMDKPPVAPLPAIILPSSLRAPKYDCDFTNLAPEKEVFCHRGTFCYRRPIGWTRIALNVDRFGTDKAWLGPVDSKRKPSSQIVPGEWPVAYHGTGVHNARSIAEEGFLLSKGRRWLYGHGIYTTPSISVAELFAKNFQYEGENYKVVIQSRVNPETLNPIGGIIINNIPTEYWVFENADDVRPYGFCIKKCDDNLEHEARAPYQRGIKNHDRVIPDWCLCV